jgi:hypothetical protein
MAYTPKYKIIANNWPRLIHVFGKLSTDVLQNEADFGAHLHNGDTLQHDAVNSNGGAFAFSTTGLVTFNQSIASANYAAANKLTACATNAGTLDFSAASKTLTVENSAVVSQDYSTDASPTFAGLTVVNAITEFSTDGTLGDNSDSAVPTEKAVKTYVGTASVTVFETTASLPAPATEGMARYLTTDNKVYVARIES